MAKILTRNLTGKINRIYEIIIPSFLRNNYVFAYIVFRPVLGKFTKDYFSFKEKSKTMSQKEFEDIYERLEDSFVKRETNLNTQSIKQICKDIVGESVLDAGAGVGYLLNVIYKSNPKLELFGVDIQPSQPDLKIKYYRSNIEDLPFPSKSVDTVISTHTLEHVLNFQKALDELRRVAKKRIIIVVPRQRFSKFTPDLHLRFFPDKKTLLNAFKGTSYTCELIDNDWYYVEDIT